MDPLTRCAIRHGTDKWGLHFYTPHYHGVLGHLRDREVRLLEIGIGGYDNPDCGGLSLLMWRDYFPKGQITGFDIAEKTLPAQDRIAIVRGDQSNPHDLAACVETHGPFDIIIDDGSHRPQHVVASFNALFPTLSSPGYYIVEDTQTAYMESFGGAWPGSRANNTIDYFRDLAHHVNHAEIARIDPAYKPHPFAGDIVEIRFLHNLVIVCKGENKAPSNLAGLTGNRVVKEAIAGLDRELSREAPAIWTYCYRALLAGRTGTASAAIEGMPEDLVERLLDEPDASFAAHAEIVLAFPRLLREAGNPAAAGRVLDRLCARFAHNPVFLTERLGVLAADTTPQQATHVIDILSRADGRLALRHYHDLAETLLDAGLFGHARKVCDLALSHYHGNPAARLLRARAFAGLFDRENALADLENNSGRKYGHDAVDQLRRQIDNI